MYLDMRGCVSYMYMYYCIHMYTQTRRYWVLAVRTLIRGPCAGTSAVPLPLSLPGLAGRPSERPKSFGNVR